MSIIQYLPHSCDNSMHVINEIRAFFSLILFLPKVEKELDLLHFWSVSLIFRSMFVIHTISISEMSFNVMLAPNNKYNLLLLTACNVPKNDTQPTTKMNKNKIHIKAVQWIGGRVTHTDVIASAYISWHSHRDSIKWNLFKISRLYKCVMRVDRN